MSDLPILYCGCKNGSVAPVSVNMDLVGVVGLIFGWFAFIVWTASFYPQLVVNYRAKSIVGYSMDFWLLNCLGYICYSAYCAFLALNSYTRELYFETFGSHDVPVDSNDCAFAWHGLIISFFIGYQIIAYDRGKQRLSRTAILIVVGLFASIVVAGVLVAVSPEMTFLNFVQWLGTVKVVITICKYVPQVALNHQRKSTKGFAISGIWLDCAGGVAQMLQMACDGIESHHWNVIFGNATKLGLSVITFGFDGWIFVQHYILYPTSKQPKYKKMPDESTMSVQLTDARQLPPA